MARKRREDDVGFFGRNLRFKPKDGLFFLIAGLPIFLGLRVFGSGNLENLRHDFLWALLMAMSVGLLATFTKLFETDPPG